MQCHPSSSTLTLVLDTGDAYSQVQKDNGSFRITYTKIATAFNRFAFIGLRGGVFIGIGWPAFYDWSGESVKTSDRCLNVC